MVKVRSMSWVAAALVSALAIASGPPAASVNPTLRFGRANGIWELPLGANAGWVDGNFYELSPAPTPGPAYHLTATLSAHPVACPACVSGSLQGVLDDGLPGTPNLAVVGTYSGTWANGSGTFSAQIFGAASNAPVGRFQGAFADPPLLPVLGQFHGKWMLR